MTEIKGTTKVCGLIGNPVEHSLSPLIHNELARAMNIDMAYVTFRVQNNVSLAVKGAYELNVGGMNVTVPWKQDVIEALVETDELAKNIGAVNTLVRTDGGFKGYNTDIIGIKRELEEVGVDIKDKVVLILGAGGAARAIAFLMANEGAKNVFVLNRTLEKANVIAEDVNTKLNTDVVYPLELSDYEKIIEDDYIVIQTTSVGLYPNVEEVAIKDKSFYDRAMCGVDIIYNPANTKFMQLMKESGKKAYNGLKMLLYQAVAAFELWNDVTVPKEVCDDVYAKLETELSK